MSNRTLRLGTRASALALWQARHVAARIGALPGAPPIELVPLTTSGDTQTQAPLWAVDGRAFFTKEIDRALLEGDIDIAVHSLKDLSTVIEPGLELAATLEREDPRDVLVSRDGASLASLAPGARIGTSSLRRRAFIARLRPDCRTLELRGNVPTRLERLRGGDYDAIVLAGAGLRRLGLEAEVTEWLAADAFLPAVSQGALGICIRAGDDLAGRWVGALDHLPTRLAVTAERALLRRLEGGCQVPLGALARIESGRLVLQVSICTLAGDAELRASGHDEAATPAAAAQLGERVADDLLSRGGGELVRQERARAGTVAPP